MLVHQAGSRMKGSNSYFLGPVPPVGTALVQGHPALPQSRHPGSAETRRRVARTQVGAV